MQDMTPLSRNKLSWLLGGTLAGIVFIIYFLTLAPGALGGDPGELQFVPSFLGLTHPSGYPLQVLLDKLWVSIIPWGSVAWRTNLLSAVLATLGVMLVYIYGLKSTNMPIVALLGASMLAFTTVYWSQAVLSDKYALNGLLTACLLVASLLFWSKTTLRTLTILVFFVGLSLAHHRALAVFLPAIGLLILAKGWGLLLKWRTWFVILPAFLLPLSLYLFVYFTRKNIPPYFVTAFTPTLFFDYILFWGSRGQVRFIPAWLSLVNYGNVFLQNFFWPLIVFCCLGLILRYRQNKQKLGWLAFLLGCFLLSGYFAANYENFEIVRRYVYFTPSYVVLSALAVEGFAGWFGWVSTKSPARWPGALLMTTLFVIALVPLPGRFQIQWREQHLPKPLNIWRQTLKSGQMADRMAASLALVKEPEALIVADWEQASPLWYAQLIDGYCPRCIIRHDMSQLNFYHNSYPERPIYVSRTVPDVDAWSEPTSVGPLVRLDDSPLFEYDDSDVLPLDITFDNTITLKGLRWVFGPPIEQPGKVLSFELIWQRPETGSEPPPYAISLRLLGPNGQYWQEDQTAPVLAMHPFGEFAPGQIVSDFYEVLIPMDAPAGSYNVQIVLYQEKGESEFKNAEAFSSNAEDLGQSPVIYSFQILDN